MLKPRLLSRWQNELFCLHLFEMSQYFPVFNLGLVYAQSHSWKRKWELLKGKTTDLATESIWIFSKSPLPMYKNTALKAATLLLRGDLGESLLVSLPVTTSCICGKRAQIPRLPPTSRKSHAANSGGFCGDAFPQWTSGWNPALHYGCWEGKYRLQALRFSWN